MLPAKALMAPGIALPTSAASIAVPIPCCSGGIIRVVDSYCFGMRKAIAALNRRETIATRNSVFRRSQSNEMFGTHLSPPLTLMLTSTLWSCVFNVVLLYSVINAHSSEESRRFVPRLSRFVHHELKVVESSSVHIALKPGAKTPALGQYWR